MRRKTVLLIFIFCLISFFINSCATIRMPGEQTSVGAVYNNSSFDDVWDASIFAIQDVGFIIKTLEKSSGLIYAEMKTTVGGRVLFGGLAQDRQMNVTIRESEGTVSVQMVELTSREKSAKEFFDALDARLGVKRVGFTKRKGNVVVLPFMH